METIARNPPFPGSIDQSDAGSTWQLWAGRIFSGLAVAFLLFDSAGKRVVLLSCVLAYVIRGTSVLGALLLTGYLGGAVATHVRLGNPPFTHVLFPTYLAGMLWGGLILRDARLRAFLPLRRHP